MGLLQDLFESEEEKNIRLERERREREEYLKDNPDEAVMEYLGGIFGTVMGKVFRLAGAFMEGIFRDNSNDR